MKPIKLPKRVSLRNSKYFEIHYPDSSFAANQNSITVMITSKTDIRTAGFSAVILGFISNHILEPTANINKELMTRYKQHIMSYFSDCEIEDKNSFLITTIKLLILLDLEDLIVLDDLLSYFSDFDVNIFDNNEPEQLDIVTFIKTNSSIIAERIVELKNDEQLKQAMIDVLTILKSKV